MTCLFSRARWLGRPFTALSLTFAAILGLQGSAHADFTAYDLDPARTLVIYGDIEYLDPKAQPQLAGMLSNAGRDRRLEDQRKALLNRLRDRVQRRDVSRALASWSTHPLAITLDDALKAVKKATGRDLPTSKSGRIEAAFDKIFGLVFVGGFEQLAVLETPTRRQGTLYHDHFAVTVTALLYDLKTSEIVLSASAIDIQERGPVSRPLDDKGEIARSFAVAYGEAADDALQRLIALMNRMSAGAAEERWDTVMVTDLAMAGSKARQLFRFDGPDQADGNFCPVRTLCRQGGDACRKVVGLLTNGVTSALSEAGLRTLPPWTLADWATSAERQVTVTLRLPQFSSDIARASRRIRLDASEANVKIIPRLDGIDETVKDLKLATQHAYYSVLSYKEARDTRDSARGCPPSGPVRTVNPQDFVGVAFDDRAKRAPTPTSSMERLFYTVAMYKVLENIAKSQEVTRGFE